MLARSTAACVAALSVLGCSGSSDSGSEPKPWSDPLVELPCSDSIADVYGAPPALTDPKGTILRCARDRYLDKTALTKQAKASGYSGPDFTSGVHIYRVMFRTERGDAAVSPGFSTGVIYVPDTPVADSMPLVSSAHGTVGQAEACEISKQPAADADPPAQFIPLAGFGYPVIAPDFAGYSQFGSAGNPPSGYMVANDAPKSIIDGVHALRSMIPSHAAQEVFITGHSQGGHVALSALAMSSDYPVDGKLAGVVAYSPFWISNLIFGAGLMLPIPIADNDFTVATAVWYYFSRAELSDGPGHGPDVFAANLRDGITSFFDTACNAETTKLEALATTAPELVDPDFLDGVGHAAVGPGKPCPGDGSPADAFCQKWIPRLKSDRPHLSGAALDVPILYVYGDEDATIPINFASCAIDRLHADGADVRSCVFPGADHGGILHVSTDYVTHWMAEQALGGADPGTCDKDFTLTTDGNGKTTSSLTNGAGAVNECTTLVANDAD
jgi:pimeloyl-ACP methyl ester carboxylesterase